MTLDVASHTDGVTLSSLFEGTSEEREHILEALRLLGALFERMAGGESLDTLIQKLKEAATRILGDEILKQWFDDLLAYCRASLADVRYAHSEKAKKERKELRERWEGMLEMEEWKSVVEGVKSEVRKAEGGLREDEGLKAVREAQRRLGNDLKEVAGDEMLLCWRDFIRVYLPRVLSKLKSLPIPRYVWDVSTVFEVLNVRLL